MAYLGRKGATAPLNSADIPAELVVSQAEMNTAKTNIALLGFKTAVNGSLAKYNLQDQVIDEYAHASDTSGIDADASTNEVLASGAYSGTTTPTVTHNAQATGTSGNYTWYKYTTPGTVQYQTDTAQDHDYVVVAGGGGGGGFAGGGAGGFRTSTGIAVAASTNITVTVGAGGAGGGSGQKGSTGGNSVFSTITSSGGGGGGAFSNTNQDGNAGGSGGGGGTNATPSPYDFGDGGAGNAGSYTPVEGYAGGGGVTGTGGNSGCGGGGASAIGGNGSSQTGGAGGAGENNIMGMNDTDSDTLMDAASAGHDVGGLRYLAGGGGGTGSVTKGTGGNGGGGNGKVSSTAPTDGTDGTGGGGGGGYSSTGGDGGNGIVIIRHLSSIIVDVSLQSTDTEAEAQPTKADMVMLVEDAGSGVATLGTHIKGYISRDSGTTFTEGTLVDEGDWGTDKRILAFHDLDISGQPADQTMCYKITTHSASAVYNTKIHATSMGWR